MAEVGCYSLVLYCDSPTCERRGDPRDPTRYRAQKVGNFEGRNLREARHYAKATGWRIRRGLAPSEGRRPTWECPRCRREHSTMPRAAPETARHDTNDPAPEV